MVAPGELLQLGPGPDCQELSIEFLYIRVTNGGV
jgi:hypothetical protein